MTKNITLAASIVMLVAISGQAFAGTAMRHVRSEDDVASHRLTTQAFDAMTAPAFEPAAHHYNGGPKSND